MAITLGVPQGGEDSGASARGHEPAPLPEVALAAGQVQRHSVEQTIENLVPVQILDVPVPSVVMEGVRDRILQRLVEQMLMDDTEQQIEVTTVSCPDRPPPRAVLSSTQMAVQLVEVPPVSPSSCVLNALVPQMGHELVEVPNVVSQSTFQQQFVEQTVDIQFMV